MTTAQQSVERPQLRARKLFAAMRLLRAFRGTTALTALVVAVGILTGTLLRGEHAWILDHVGTDRDSLMAGRVWTMPLATVIQAEAGIKWHQALLLFLFVGLLEYQVGTMRALATFFVTDWLSSPATVVLLSAMGTLGSSTADRLSHTPDMGSSAASLGAFAAAVAVAPSPWRVVGGAGLLVVLPVTFTFERLDVSIAHLLAALTGFAIALLFLRYRRIRMLPLPVFNRERTRP